MWNKYREIIQAPAYGEKTRLWSAWLDNLETETGWL